MISIEALRQPVVLTDLSHHAASSLDYLPADPHIDSMLMVAKTSESPSAVKMSHKPMKDPKLEIADEE